MWIITKTFQITFWGSLVLLKLIPYFSGTIKPTIFAIYFETLGVRDMQFRNQSVFSIWMWVITKSFQMTFWGSLVLLKLIPYFSATIKPSVFAIYFETLGVRDMQFRNQSVFNVDVDHYRNILDYLLGVPSIAQINPIFFCNN